MKKILKGMAGDILLANEMLDIAFICLYSNFIYTKKNSTCFLSTVKRLTVSLNSLAKLILLHKQYTTLTWEKGFYCHYFRPFILLLKTTPQL